MTHLVKRVKYDREEPPTVDLLFQKKKKKKIKIKNKKKKTKALMLTRADKINLPFAKSEINFCRSRYFIY